MRQRPRLSETLFWFHLVLLHAQLLQPDAAGDIWSVCPSSPCKQPILLLEGLGKSWSSCWDTLPVGVRLPFGVPMYPWAPRRLQLSPAYLARAGAQDGSVCLSGSVLHHSLALHLQQRHFFHSGYCYLLVLAPHSSKGSPTASGFVQSETRGHSTSNLRSRRGGESKAGTGWGRDLVQVVGSGQMPHFDQCLYVHGHTDTQRKQSVRGKR